MINVDLWRNLRPTIELLYNIYATALTFILFFTLPQNKDYFNRKVTWYYKYNLHPHFVATLPTDVLCLTQQWSNRHLNMNVYYLQALHWHLATITCLLGKINSYSSDAIGFCSCSRRHTSCCYWTQNQTNIFTQNHDRNMLNGQTRPKSTLYAELHQRKMSKQPNSLIIARNKRQTVSSARNHDANSFKRSKTDSEHAECGGVYYLNRLIIWSSISDIN